MTTIKTTKYESPHRCEIKPRIYPLLDPALASHDGARKEKEIREMTARFFNQN